MVFLDGSFVTSKEFPDDYDGCYDIVGLDPEKVDPVFFDFKNHRAAQKVKYYGEFLPAQAKESGSGRIFLDFFQIDKMSGMQKGIIAIDLGGI